MVGTAFNALMTSLHSIWNTARILPIIVIIIFVIISNSGTTMRTFVRNSGREVAALDLPQIAAMQALESCLYLSREFST